ncbi:MAG: DUF4266 domain-containing protein [Gammaproteobacteria bacterium]|nr:DUF4266 domain-containing protein [Gammaproteobacteria bacterium]
MMTTSSTSPLPKTLHRCLATLLILSLLSACSVFKLKPVRPWDRDILAKPEMQLDADVMEAEMDEKIYYSKEASRGGAGVGGGGCGCN